MTSERSKQLETIAGKALDGAKARGVKDARIVVYQSRSVSVTYRKGRPDKVQDSSKRSLTLHLYIDGKYTACETNDLRDAALAEFLDSSVAMCKAMAKDPYRVITDPALYNGKKAIDLELFDSEILAFDQKGRHERAAKLEATAAANAGDNAISVEASYEDEKAELFQLHSNGFEGWESGTEFWMFAEVSVQDKGDKRPSGWAEAGSRCLAGLSDPGEVGAEAARSALCQLGASRIGTQKMPMIVENRAAGGLLEQLIGAASGRALQQRSSFLEGRLNQKVGSELLDLTDQPFISGGFGSRLFDSEGISAKEMKLFEKGVLKNFYIDTYYGKKLGMAPTTGSISNLVVAPGKRSLDELISGISKGILVRGFVGGNSNATTGDFSVGVFGTLIEKGKLAGAVSEMNVSGNHKELWQKLADVGSDPYPYSELCSPSLLFDKVQISGM